MKKQCNLFLILPLVSITLSLRGMKEEYYDPSLRKALELAQELVVKSNQENNNKKFCSEAVFSFDMKSSYDRRLAAIKKKFDTKWPFPTDLLQQTWILFNFGRKFERPLETKLGKYGIKKFQLTLLPTHIERLKNAFISELRICSEAHNNPFYKKLDACLEAYLKGGQTTSILIEELEKILPKD